MLRALENMVVRRSLTLLLGGLSNIPLFGRICSLSVIGPPIAFVYL